MNESPKAETDAKRCDACAWSRMGKVVLVDPFASSNQCAALPALFCHRERPRERVAPDGFCPDFEGRT